MPKEAAKTFFKTLGFEVKSVNEDDFTLDGVFSTADLDRHGEIVEQAEWQLGDYLKNPVVLFAHDHFRYAVGQMISLGFDNAANLMGKIKFAVKENPEAKVLFDLYKGGFMRAFSVGFTAEPEFDEKESLVRLRNPLLYEVSLVNVPANAMALAKQMGVDVSLLEKAKEAEAIYERAMAKEGRVLSKKNREKVAQAKEALEELLAADDASREAALQKDLSPDKTGQSKKVETPRQVRAGVPYMEQKMNRIINNVVRNLLETKR